MSRVYEALKSAQDQRTPRGPLETETQLSERGVFNAGQNSEAARRISEILSAVRPEAARPTRPLEFENLQLHCSKPKWEPKPQWSAFSSEQPAEGQAEQFRTLRARLYALRETRPIRTLLVTSTSVGEGKTFVAVNLAQSIARQPGRRALLVDADLRVPKLHVALGAPREPGLSDYLAGEADECSIIQAGPEGALFLIPAGKPSSNPAELLANRQLEAMFSRVVSLFDWIIVDAPPMLPVSDAGVLAAMCDGVIFVVRAGVAAYDLAQAACSELKHRNLLGAVLNGVQEKETYGAYGYY